MSTRDRDDIDYAGPTGRELPGEHWNARIIREQAEATPRDKAECPDGGTCHHKCPGAASCFRVAYCGPLSGVFPGDEWPGEARAIVKANREPTIEDHIFGGDS
jgi:hypothetical protein